MYDASESLALAARASAERPTCGRSEADAPNEEEPFRVLAVHLLGGLDGLNADLGLFRVREGDMVDGVPARAAAVVGAAVFLREIHVGFDGTVAGKSRHTRARGPQAFKQPGALQKGVRQVSRQEGDRMLEIKLCGRYLML